MSTTTPIPTSTEPTAVQRWTWPVAILGLLGLNIAITAALVIRSSNDPSFAAESNAYEKAVRWDEHLAQIQFNRSLGWTAAMKIESAANGRHELTIELRDPKGAGVTDTNVRVETFHHARAADVRMITLAQDSGTPGMYRAPIDIPRAGLWEVRLTATQVHNTFTAEETITVATADFAAGSVPGDKR